MVTVLVVLVLSLEAGERWLRSTESGEMAGSQMGRDGKEIGMGVEAHTAVLIVDKLPSIGILFMSHKFCLCHFVYALAVTLRTDSNYHEFSATVTLNSN